MTREDFVREEYERTTGLSYPEWRNSNGFRTVNPPSSATFEHKRVQQAKLDKRVQDELRDSVMNFVASNTNRAFAIAAE